MVSEVEHGEAWCHKEEGGPHIQTSELDNSSSLLQRQFSGKICSAEATERHELRTGPSMFLGLSARFTAAIIFVSDST